MQKVIHFIKYNNAFTIGIMMLFLGAGMTFAASPAARGSVYSSSEKVTSIDNHLIVSTNLDGFNFNLKINSVTEDAKSYYIKYSYQTLAIENGAWQKVSREKTMTVSKASLEEKDLGLYVAGQLGENINYELSYLKEVQTMQKGLTNKVVTVQYAGLVGKLLDPKEKVIRGYNPVIPEEAAVLAAVEEPKVSPDPSLFVENIPGYVKPPLNNPPPAVPFDEYAVRKVVEEMLAQHQPAPVVPPPTEELPPPAEEPPTPPEETPPAEQTPPPEEIPTPEPTPPPAEEPAPEPTPPPEETPPESTPPPAETPPAPDPAPEPGT